MAVTARKLERAKKKTVGQTVDTLIPAVTEQLFKAMHPVPAFVVTMVGVYPSGFITSVIAQKGVSNRELASALKRYADELEVKDEATDAITQQQLQTMREKLN